MKIIKKIFLLRIINLYRKDTEIARWNGIFHKKIGVTKKIILIHLNRQADSAVYFHKMIMME